MSLHVSINAWGSAKTGGLDYICWHFEALREFISIWNLVLNTLLPALRICNRTTSKNQTEVVFVAPSIHHFGAWWISFQQFLTYKRPRCGLEWFSVIPRPSGIVCAPLLCVCVSCGLPDWKSKGSWTNGSWRLAEERRKSRPPLMRARQIKFHCGFCTLVQNQS